MAQEIAGEGAAGLSGINAADVSSLTLAYIGDSFYELTIRTEMLRRHNAGAGDVDKYTKKFTNAPAQAKIAELLEAQLSEEEYHIFKRGRNAKSVSAPHSCSIGEYRKATGLEALVGHLYLSGKEGRARELILAGLRLYEESIG